MDIEEQIRHQCPESFNDKLRTTVYTKLNKRDGRYGLSYFDEDGIEFVGFDEELQKELNRVEKELDETYSIHREGNVGETVFYWRCSARKVVVSVPIRFTIVPELFKFVQHAANKSNDRIESSERVVSLSAHRAPVKGGFSDATCVYETKSPHEIISNYDTLDEYIEQRADNEEELAKLQSQEYYKTHYHPVNADWIVELVEKVDRELYGAISVMSYGRKSIVSIDANGSSFECTQSVVVDVTEL